jgi:hypothetical protein
MSNRIKFCFVFEIETGNLLLQWSNSSKHFLPSDFNFNKSQNENKLVSVSTPLKEELNQDVIIPNQHIPAGENSFDSSNLYKSCSYILPKEHLDSSNSRKFHSFDSKQFPLNLFSFKSNK